MLEAILVFLGGGLGAVGRHGINVAAGRLFGLGFPSGTMIANIIGSFAMGVIASYLAFKAEHIWSQHARLFLTTGFLGGFTTFSAFSLDTALLWERGAHVVAAVYVLISVGISVLGLFAGLTLVRTLT